LFRSADVVFANLESPLSDQNGETEDPGSNMIFTGPAEGALSIARSGITIVGTANNHAFDYGKTALFQTIQNLDEAHVMHVGTTRVPESLYVPVRFTVEGITFAFFAVTDIMNSKQGWEDWIALADTSKLFPRIREASRSSDVVVLSYHGGVEFAEKPSARTVEFAQASIRQGVALFLGHHPHVPYGIEKIGTGYAVHSLGNLVFLQPQNDWARMSYGVAFTIEKKDTCITFALQGVYPIEAGFQPRPLEDSSARTALQRRLTALSNIPITLTKKENP
jgi:poly-gamma-glutamate synthesis protein (capsule biosynthesis protein)